MTDDGPYWSHERMLENGGYRNLKYGDTRAFRLDLARRAAADLRASQPARPVPEKPPLWNKFSNTDKMVWFRQQERERNGQG